MSGPRLAEQRVLPTLNTDGSRLKLRPRLVKGRFYRCRKVLAWVLMLVFAACPLIHIGGKPLVLLDLSRREFRLFGHTFLSSDNVLLLFTVVSLVITLFLLTALLGRVWCGWACPQTVYMEFLFRPVERRLERGRAGKKTSRRIFKHVIFALLSLALAHVFLAYFVPVRELVAYLTRSPFEHPAAFLVMAATAGLIYFDFAYFREQTCMVACPYGRLQAVLLDRRSLIVAYDKRRGEPRGPVKRKAAPAVSSTAADQNLGDCTDCGLCTRVCPMGIDIRNGLQMECITCTQCLDACNSVMSRVKRPLGLVRYSSQEAIAGRDARILRPRVVIYPLLLVLSFTALGLAVSRKDDTDVTVLRGLGSPYNLMDDGKQVSGQLRVRIVNRGRSKRRYQIGLVDPRGIQVIAPVNPLPVGPGKTETAILFLITPRNQFKAGRRLIDMRVTDGGAFDRTFDFPLLGPGN